MQGARSVAFVQQAFPLSDGGVEFGSAAVDVRRYYRMAGEYVVAMRGMVGGLV